MKKAVVDFLYSHCLHKLDAKGAGSVPKQALLSSVDDSVCSLCSCYRTKQQAHEPGGRGKLFKLLAEEMIHTHLALSIFHNSS